MAVLTEKELQIRLKLRDDFPHYAYKCLKVRTKSGAITEFALNRAQLFLHKKIEEHKRKTGKVRVVILKGRQVGASTQITGRFYHRISHFNGVRAFILTHQQAATDNLFEIVKRFHSYCPVVVRPIEGANSAKELNFISPESGYKVGTAGSKGIGRSGTIQLFHGSEVAFWENGTEHIDGIFQSVPRENNTEIILESTANGKANMFHKLWSDAIAGVNEFEPIFIPWYWAEEYRIPIDKDFVLTEEEHDYKRLYDLDNAQINFRRITTNNSHLKEMGFRQEYPSTPEEAFIASGDAFISGMLIDRARQCQGVTAAGLKFIGVDPAGMGDDRTSIIIRQGRKAYGLQSYLHYDTMEIVGLILKLIKEENPDFICVDTIGLGAGVGDRLKELGYGNIVKHINSGVKAFNPDKYYNKRAEMWGLMQEWLENEPVSIPDSNSLAADLSAPKLVPNDSLNRIKLERKEDFKKRTQQISPDEADALALTFAFPAASNNANIGNIFSPNIRF